MHKSPGAPQLKEEVDAANGLPHSTNPPSDHASLMVLFQVQRF